MNSEYATTDFVRRMYCVDKYSDYASNRNIKIFYETDDTKRTFEIILYGDNPALCDTLFDSPALDYMLSNKTEEVCVMLNKATAAKYAAGKLCELAASTRNKLYVAITRAHGKVYLINE